MEVSRSAGGEGFERLHGVSWVVFWLIFWLIFWLVSWLISWRARPARVSWGRTSAGWARSLPRMGRALGVGSGEAERGDEVVAAVDELRVGVRVLVIECDG